jgi:hypothetical protein
MSLKFLKIYDRPITFHPSFVDLTGSHAAALMLAQAIYWCLRTEDPDGWFWKDANGWYEETRLTRREQEGARALLRKTGFWLEKKGGAPARLFYRIDGDLLQKRIMEIPDSEFDKKVNLDSTKSEIQIRQKGESRFDKKVNLDSTKREIWIRQKGESRFDKKGNSDSTKREIYIGTESTTESTAESTAEEEASAPPFDNFTDHLSEMSKAIATLMGLPAVPEGPEAEPLHKAAADFLAANILPKDISDFENDFHRRKVAQGKLITLTLKILCADLPGWVRARRMQNGIVPADNSRTAQRLRAREEGRKKLFGG